MTRAIDAAAVHGIVEAAMTEWDVPGVAVALVQGDEVLLQRGFGVRELGKPEPVDPETVFRIGSCSKAFTAAAIGILVDEGKLGWDDRVVDHLPHFRLCDPYLTTLVTVRDLLAHRVSLDSFYIDETMNVSRDDIIRYVQYDAPIPAFRAQFAYNDMLYVVAGQLIPAVTGMDWDTFLQQRVFVPLGMTTSSTTGYWLDATPNHAAAHVYEADGVLRPYAIPKLGPDEVENLGACGNVNASLAGLTTWLRLHMGGGGEVDGVRLVSQATAKELHAPQMLHRDGRRFRASIDGYGLGWFLDWHGQHRLIQHTGHYWAYTSAIGFLPERRIGFVVLCNATRSGFPLALGQTLLDHLLEAEPGTWLGDGLERWRSAQAKEDREWSRALAARVPGTRPSVPLERFSGRYQFRPYDQWRVSVQDGCLRLERLNSHKPFEAALEHWHDDTFLAHWNEKDTDIWPARLVTFTLTADNQPWRMDFYHGGGFYYYREPGPNQPTRELILVSE